LDGLKNPSRKIIEGAGAMSNAGLQSIVEERFMPQAERSGALSQPALIGQWPRRMN
jgi:hypothetical protein